MFNIEKHKIMKLFNNFGVKDPLERSVNDICKEIHKSVYDALEERTLTAMIYEFQTDKDVIGTREHSSKYKMSCDITQEACRNEFKREATNYNNLASLAVKKYNTAIKNAGYHYHVSELQFESEGFYFTDRTTGLCYSFRYVGKFYVDIILDDASSVKSIDNLIANMDKRDW